ncbi:MAG: nucleotide pyrophosphohydrolase [Desulfovibrionaceae bacterium]
MSDQMAELTARLLRFRDEREWKPLQTPKNLAMSVAIEAGELLERYQWMPEDHLPMGEELAETASEMADVFIYLLLLADRLGVDLAEAAWAKIEVNEARKPPVRKPV